MRRRLRRRPRGPLPWQDAYQQAVEAHGGQIERLEFPDDDHFSLPQAAAPQAQVWLAQRFAVERDVAPGG